MSQQIPKGYELESVLDFEEDGRTVSGIVYATSDSKFLIVRDGYKTTTFYVFSTESYKLTNKVTIDTYIPSSSFRIIFGRTKEARPKVDEINN